MARLLRKRAKKRGLPPGTLVHVGEKKIERPRVTVIDYSESRFTEQEVRDVDDYAPPGDADSVTWINVDGVHDPDLIQAIGCQFGLHPLVLEDIMSTTQRPKMEDYGDTVYIVFRMFCPHDTDGEENYEQVSLVVGKNYVLSFQEHEGDVFDSVRERIRTGKGRVRRFGSDYLAYALIDSVVDSFFTVLEKIGEELEALEERLLADPTPKVSHEVHRQKREMIFLRKSIWPLREVINALQHGDSALFREPTTLYLRDVYDHTIQVIETVETFRDMLSGMLDTYLSSVSNKMNEIMKVLTIIATIFIPLTFIAGVYGMNFRFMPELGWRWGYFAVLGAMAVVGLIMVLYFKRKRWL